MRLINKATLLTTTFFALTAAAPCWADSEASSSASTAADAQFQSESTGLRPMYSGPGWGYNNSWDNNGFWGFGNGTNSGYDSGTGAGHSWGNGWGNSSDSINVRREGINDAAIKKEREAGMRHGPVNSSVVHTRGPGGMIVEYNFPHNTSNKTGNTARSKQENSPK